MRHIPLSNIYFELSGYNQSYVLKFLIPLRMQDKKNFGFIQEIGGIE